jgi:hypothetical protein
MRPKIAMIIWRIALALGFGEALRRRDQRRLYEHRKRELAAQIAEMEARKGARQ